MLPIAATALLLLTAGAAHAQRVDTRRIDIQRTDNGGHTCRFNARPDLRMTHGPAGHLPRAEWLRKDRSGEATLIVRLTPGKRRHGLWTFVDQFTLPWHGPRPDAARLLLDGRPSPVGIAIAEERGLTGRLRILPAQDDREALAEAMMQVKLAELVLHDRAGAPIRRYTFDIGRLDTTVEIPAIVRWKCPGR